MSHATAIVSKRALSALQTAFVADAMAAPAHWYYDKESFDAAFPGGSVSRTKFNQVPPKHPFTFMKTPEADPAIGGKKLVGEVILRRTGVNWGPQNAHPHCSLQPGENTTNANVSRLLLRTLAKEGGYSPDGFLDAYIAFMTDPKQENNNDTYAEGYHRNFFTALLKGKPKTECGDASEGAASAGALTTQPALIIFELLKGRDIPRVQAIARKHLFLTAPHERAGVVTDAFVVLIDTLLFRETIPGSPEDEQVVIAALTKAAAVQNVDLADLLATSKTDTDVMGGKYSVSCDLNNSWPSVLFLAAKYVKNPFEALIANTNISGENCHRGYILGSILGLIATELPAEVAVLESQLVAGADIRAEVAAAFDAKN